MEYSVTFKHTKTTVHSFLVSFPLHARMLSNGHARMACPIDSGWLVMEEELVFSKDTSPVELTVLHWWIPRDNTNWSR